MPTAARPGSDTGIEETCCPCDTPKGPPPPPYRYIIPTPSGAPRNRIVFSLTDNTRPRSQTKEPDPAPTPIPAFRKASKPIPCSMTPPRLSPECQQRTHPRYDLCANPLQTSASSPEPHPRNAKIPAPPARPAGPIPRRHRRVRIPVTGRAGPAPAPRGGLNGRSDLIAARSGTCRRCLCFGRYHYIRCVRHREDPCGIFRTVFFARPGGGSARNPAPRGRHRPGRRLEGVLRLTAAPQPAYLDAYV